MNEHLYIGVLSGTSMDAIDVALVSFRESKESIHQFHAHESHQETPRLLHTLSYPIPNSFRQHCLSLCQSGEGSIDDYGKLDVEAGEIFASAVLALLKAAKVPANKIYAIGSHGQTLRHRPDATPPFTLQIGDPNIIAERTEIPTIADFRRRDMAAGGQGAPLAPGFHASVFGSHQENRVIVNIGGISNITILNRDSSVPVTGFDTGPGNSLMDFWAKMHWKIPFDVDGKIASEGEVQTELLNQLLADPFFKKPPPKSTGRDYFNQAWLDHYLNLTFIKKPFATLNESYNQKQNKPQNETETHHKALNETELKNIQATLLALTSHSLANAIIQHAPLHHQIYICGGGVHNRYLMQNLSTLLGSERSVQSTEELGLPPDWIEAILFAWLAKQTLEGKSGNCPSVTGARRAISLGGIFGFRPVMTTN